MTSIFGGNRRIHIGSLQLPKGKTLPPRERLLEDNYLLHQKNKQLEARLASMTNDNAKVYKPGIIKRIFSKIGFGRRG